MFPRINGLRTMELGYARTALRDSLNSLVLFGTKRATAGILLEYEREQEEVENVGEIMYLVDSDTKPIATIEITNVKILNFYDVTFEFAEMEGEGFRDIEHWRESHIRFYKEGGDIVDQKTQIVCIEFKLCE